MREFRATSLDYPLVCSMGCGTDERRLEFPDHTVQEEEKCLIIQKKHNFFLQFFFLGQVHAIKRRQVEDSFSSVQLLFVFILVRFCFHSLCQTSTPVCYQQNQLVCLQCFMPKVLFVNSIRRARSSTNKTKYKNLNLVPDCSGYFFVQNIQLHPANYTTNFLCS